jgi:hypothetical protein
MPFWPDGVLVYSYSFQFVTKPGSIPVTNLALASGLQGLCHVKLGAQLYISSQALFTPSLFSLVFFNISCDEAGALTSVVPIRFSAADARPLFVFVVVATFLLYLEF